jgi:zinc/manganese transport system substrate-binding protein
MTEALSLAPCFSKVWPASQTCRNRFNGFDPVLKSAKAVGQVSCVPGTLLRRGINGRAVRGANWVSAVVRLAACSCLLLGALTGQAKLDVVVTTPDLAAVAREVGGDRVSIACLAKPTEDPHFVDAKPSFVLKLNHADALIEGGAELEIGWLPALLSQARNSKLAAGAPGRIFCNQGVQMLEVPGALDRSKGDIHAAGNPHYLMDPANARIAAANIAGGFSKIDPAGSAVFQANLQKFTAQLDAKLAAWEKQMAPFKGQQVVSYHNSWIYFARRFGLNMDTFLEPKPGVPPTPAHLAEVIGRMKQEKTRVVFSEPFLNRRTAEKVAGDTGAALLDVTQFPGGVKGTEGGYLQLLDYLVNSLAKALAGGK